MPELSHCPRCDKQVSLPAGADPESRVRCPMCESEYLLADALALAPPMLVLLDAPRPQAAAVAAAPAGGFAGWGDEDDTALEIESADASAPAGPRVSGAPTDELIETIDAEDFGQALAGPDFEGASLSGAGPDDIDLDGSAFGAELDKAEFGDDPNENEFAPSFDDMEVEAPGNEMVPASDPFAFGGGPVKAGGAVVLDSKRGPTGDVPNMAPLGNRRRRKGKSPVRQMISVVFGGVFGLTLGFFILLWIAGKDATAGYMDLAKKLPSFMVPKKFQAGGVTKAKDSATPEPQFVKDMKEQNKFDFGASGPGDLPSNVQGNGFDPNKGPANPPGDVAPTGNGNPADEPTGDGTPGEPSLDTPSLDDPVDPLTIGAPTIGEPKLPGTEPAATDPAATTDDIPTGDDPPPAGDDPAPSDPAPTEPAANVDATAPVDPTDEAAPARDAFLVAGRTESTLDQLKEALDTAKANQDGLLQGSLDNPSFKKTKVAAYLKFCKLADAYTFTKFKSNERKSELLKDGVKELVLTMIDARLARPDIEKIGDQWLKSPKRTNNGIVIVGTVQKVEKAGKMYATTIRCASTPDVVVLSTDQPFWKAPESIIALGTIVEDPTTNLIGYEGPASIAVFANLIQTCN